MAAKRLLQLASILLLLGLGFMACAPPPAPTPTVTLSPQPTVVPTDLDAFCPLPRNWITYRTQPGDSLQSLAQRTSSTVMQLATGNCLNNPRGLPSGQVIYLPRPPITP